MSPAERAPSPGIDPQFLALLACPESHQELALASSTELESVNRKIAAGQQKNVAGQVVSEALVAGLMRADKRRLYPIRDGIPVLLNDEGLPL